MDNAMVKEALEHDAANKAANGTVNAVGEDANSVERPVMQDLGAVPTEPPIEKVQHVDVGFDVLCSHLDQKNAMLAKSVSMSLVEVARIFTAQAMTQKDPGKMLVPSDASKALEVVATALKLANEADRLGDKGIIRGTMTIGGNGQTENASVPYAKA